jgi:hypothetical protein
MDLSRLVTGQRHVLLFCCGLISAGAAGSGATPQWLRPEAACAAYDLHFITLIEDYGLMGLGDPEAIAKSAMLMEDARAACRTGDFERGLRIYQAVDLTGVPATPFYYVGLR